MVAILASRIGLLDTIRGTTDDATSDDANDTEGKYAVLLNAGPEQPATANNAFGYVLELDEGGYDVQLYLDGKATKWPSAFLVDEDRPFSHNWGTIQSRGLLAGACGYCANAFDAEASCERADVSLLGGGGKHAPSVAELADDGYELVTIG